LVTGADGFIGSHLVELLISLGLNVRAFVYYNSFNSWGWLDSFPQEVLENIDIFSGDIRDPSAVENAVKGCDVVMHLAALIAIPYSYISPDSYIETNIKGTLNILQAARKLKIKRVLVTSTSEVYGTAKYTPMDENHPYQGQSPYSATKIGADRLAESYYRSFGVPITIVRPFNTFGPRQSARAFIPTVITQLLKQPSYLKIGNLLPTRDFNYVKDVVRAFHQISESDNTVGKELNIATGEEVSMGIIAERLIKLISPKTLVLEDPQRLRPEASEVDRLVGDSALLRNLTGWKPEYNFDKALKETIEWFNEPDNLLRYKTHNYNV